MVRRAHTILRAEVCSGGLGLGVEGRNVIFGGTETRRTGPAAGKCAVGDAPDLAAAMDERPGFARTVESSRAVAPDVELRADCLRPHAGSPARPGLDSGADGAGTSP